MGFFNTRWEIFHHRKWRSAYKLSNDERKFIASVHEAFTIRTTNGILQSMIIIRIDLDVLKLRRKVFPYHSCQQCQLVRLRN